MTEERYNEITKDMTDFCSIPVDVRHGHMLFLAAHASKISEMRKEVESSFDELLKNNSDVRRNQYELAVNTLINLTRSLANRFDETVEQWKKLTDLENEVK